MVSELSFNKKALPHGSKMVHTFIIFSLFKMAWDGSVMVSVVRKECLWTGPVGEKVTRNYREKATDSKFC